MSGYPTYRPIANYALKRLAREVAGEEVGIDLPTGFYFFHDPKPEN